MYTRISKFDLSKLYNVEYLQMMKNIKTHIERFGADSLGIGIFFEIFVSLLADAYAALESEKSSSYSQAITEGDMLRDNDYRVLYYSVKAFSFSRRPELKEAANQLMRVLRDDENPLTAGLDKESTLLENIITKLRTEPYAGYLERLQAASLLDDIAESNEAFGKLDLSRTDERSKKVSGDVKAIRVQINPIYANIRDAVNTLAARNPDSKELDEFTHLAEAEVKHYRAIVAQRETRRNNKKNSGESEGDNFTN